MQLEFALQEIDRAATRKRVEAALEKYRMYSLQMSLDKLPSVTASYSLSPCGKGGVPQSSVENAALDNVAYEIERERYINWIVRAVNRLQKQERSIIIMRYLNESEMFDYQVFREMNLSERQYYRVKSRIFYKLAFALRIEVYKEGEGYEGSTADS